MDSIFASLYCYASAYSTISSILTVISLPPECSEWSELDVDDPESDSTVGSRRRAGFGGGTFFAGSVYSGISLLVVGDRSMYRRGSATVMAFGWVAPPGLL